MRINHNISSLNAWRLNSQNNTGVQKSLEKLSSGLRINRAGDDAAGLAISEKMRGQIRGLSQAQRNIQDGISLIQTAEGALTEVHSLLQRGRELSVQAANGTYTESDREAIQRELDQIVEEVNRIGRTTEFNTKKLLDTAAYDPLKSELIKKLEDQWLGQAMKLIEDEYGLTGDGSNIKVVLEEGDVGGVLAYVSASVPPTGIGTNLELHIHMADYRAGNITDRIIAHEMVHAVFDRTVNVGYSDGIPTWFNEGSAEFIHGADERLLNELNALGGNTSANRQTIVDTSTDAWGSTSREYAGAYAAVRYMHHEIIAAGGTGIQDIFSYLEADPTRTLDQALANNSSTAFAGVIDFQTKWAADGENFIATEMDLVNTDTGSINGADAGGDGGVLDDTSVIPDGAMTTTDPSLTTPFSFTMPEQETNEALSLHLGANSSQVMKIAINKIDAESLGINTANVVSDAQGAIDRFDSAINSVSSERAKLGAFQNRLEHALAITQNNEENLTAAESRIRDVDMAKEMMGLTKLNILSQASTAMLAQSNQKPQAVLQLIS